MKSNFFRFQKWFLVLSFLPLLQSCEREVISTVDAQQVENIANTAFNVLQIPGMAYLAVKEDSIIYVGTKGYANIEKKQLFTPQTRMLIASISKTTIVTSIMQLQEKGLIDLEKDVNNYLPFECRNPNFPDVPITVKMLMTHTSSIADYSDAYFYLFGYVDYPEPLGSFLQSYLTKDGQYYTKNSYAKSRPGTTHTYSNVGAGLLAHIVENVSGMDYNAYCKTHIFQPLEMTRTTWFFSETPQDEIAIPYADNSIRDPKNPFFTYPTYPDGHLITTIEDLSKFMRAYLMKGTFNGYQLLKPETIEIILQEHFYDKYSQGLIFYLTERGEFSLWGHSGGDPGISTEMLFDVDKKVGCIFFCNRSSAYATTLELALLQYAIHQ